MDGIQPWGFFLESYFSSSNMTNTGSQTEAGKRQTWKISGYSTVSKTVRLTEISRKVLGLFLIGLAVVEIDKS
jgi:alkaline phosphatase